MVFGWFKNVWVSELYGVIVEMVYLVVVDGKCVGLKDGRYGYIFV